MTVLLRKALICGVLPLETGTKVCIHGSVESQIATFQILKVVASRRKVYKSYQTLHILWVEHLRLRLDYFKTMDLSVLSKTVHLSTDPKDLFLVIVKKRKEITSEVLLSWLSGPCVNNYQRSAVPLNEIFQWISSRVIGFIRQRLVYFNMNLIVV